MVKTEAEAVTGVPAAVVAAAAKRTHWRAVRAAGVAAAMVEMAAMAATEGTGAMAVKGVTADVLRC